MAIRLRTVNETRIALCAAETDEAPADVYLDDADHYALASKFALDWQDLPLAEYPLEWSVMASQKQRDAVSELHKFLQENKDNEAKAGE